MNALRLASSRLAGRYVSRASLSPIAGSVKAWGMLSLLQRCAGGSPTFCDTPQRDICYLSALDVLLSRALFHVMAID
jgi:hypothetical protein